MCVLCIGTRVSMTVFCIDSRVSTWVVCIDTRVPPRFFRSVPATVCAQARRRGRAPKLLQQCRRKLRSSSSPAAETRATSTESSGRGTAEIWKFAPVYKFLSIDTRVFMRVGSAGRFILEPSSVRVALT